MKDHDNKDPTAATVLPEILIKFLVVTGLFLLSVFVFSYIVYEGVIYNKALFDTRIFHFLSRYTSPTNQESRSLNLMTLHGGGIRPVSAM